MENRQTVTLAFTGDIFFGEDEVDVSPEICEFTARANLVVVNLEGPLTPTGEPRKDKQLHLKSNPDNIAVLNKLSTSAACLANNHMCDWGNTGVLNTLDLLKTNNIASVGGGLNKAFAEKPVCFQRKDLPICLLSYGAPEIGTVPATNEDAGCNIVDPVAMRDTIQKYVLNNNIVVVSIHWGATNYHYPLPEHISLGRQLIDAGATIVVGHHPHVIQGYEQYNNGLILYSLGNFIFGPFYRSGKAVNQSNENRKALIACVKVTPNRVESFEFLHTLQLSHEMRIETVSAKESKARNRFLLKLCEPIQRSDYSFFFKRYVACRIFKRAIRWLHPRMWKNFDRAYLIGLKMTWKRLFQ